MCSVDLRYLMLPVPTRYGDNDDVGYYDKSIASILLDRDTYELNVLRKWLHNQCITGLGLDKHAVLTLTLVHNTINLFEDMGHEPTGCTYLPPK